MKVTTGFFLKGEVFYITWHEWRMNHQGISDQITLENEEFLWD